MVTDDLICVDDLLPVTAVFAIHLPFKQKFLSPQLSFNIVLPLELSRFWTSSPESCVRAILFTTKSQRHARRQIPWKPPSRIYHSRRRKRLFHRLRLPCSRRTYHHPTSISRTQPRPMALTSRRQRLQRLAVNGVARMAAWSWTR